MTSVNTESRNESLYQQMLLLGKMARQAARVLKKAEEDETNIDDKDSDNKIESNEKNETELAKE